VFVHKLRSILHCISVINPYSEASQAMTKATLTHPDPSSAVNVAGYEKSFGREAEREREKGLH
jgi:hypothetical protein